MGDDSLIMPKNQSKELSVGFKKNKLTVINLHHQDKRWRKHYLCKCDCGVEKIIQGSLILSGNTKSCGCFGKENRQIATKLPNNLGVIHQIILGYKRHAKRRGFTFLLTDLEVSTIINKPCHYCGLLPSNNKITKNCNGFLYSGMDRVDSSKNYTTDNVVPCCNKCNKSKSNYSQEEFLNWVKSVYNHTFKKDMAEQWGL